MKTIYKALVGSQAYGTATPQSDHDYKGIYIQPLMEILTFDYKPQVEFNKDDVAYEVRRFLELLQSNNPTVLELLFMPEENILETSAEFKVIEQYKYEFLTKQCRNSFAGYAIQQIKKARGLEKKGNWEKKRIERKDVIDFCNISLGNGKSQPLREYIEKHCLNGPDFTYGCSAIDGMPRTHALYISISPDIVLRGISSEGKSNTIRISSIPKSEGIPNELFYCGVFHFNLDAYQIHCKEYKEYQTWLKERNTARYVDFEAHNQMIDGKNMLHCVRLIDVATEIAEKGELIVKRPNADFLLKIRRGEVDLEEILSTCESKLKTLDELFLDSNLPNEVNQDMVRDILREIRSMQFNEQ